MVSFIWKKRLKASSKSIPIYLFFVFSLLSKNAFADGDLPFAKSMTTLKTSIMDQWLPAASIIMFVVTCLMLAFGEHGEGFKRILTIVMWLSLAFGVGSFMSSMFNYSGG